jgi:hypothetical protein
MSSATQAATVSKNVVWARRAVSALQALCQLWDGEVTLVKPTTIVEATARLGHLVGVTLGLGIVVLTRIAVHVISPAAALGALLPTGELGGAFASRVRSIDDLAPVIFGMILGVLVWSGFVSRNDRPRTFGLPRRCRARRLQLTSLRRRRIADGKIVVRRSGRRAALSALRGETTRPGFTSERSNSSRP